MGELGIPRETIVQTDLAKKAQVWKLTSKSLQVTTDFGEDNIDRSTLVQPTGTSLVFTGLSDVSFDFPHCKDSFKTSIDMACAHNLVMHRSTLSHLTAIFEERRVVFPSSYVHAKLKHWTTSEEYVVRNECEFIPG